MSRGPLEEALFVDRAACCPDAPVAPFVALQRVVVRMLFDPAFVQQVYESPEQTLAGLNLDPALLRQLLANDRRLWNADRLRRSRSLKILMEEFKVTTTLVLAECSSLSFLDAFFGSSFFHEAVERRRYMALAFVAYLQDALEKRKLKSPHLAAALGMEGAMARSRRLLRAARSGFDAALAPVAAGRPGKRWVVQPGVSSHGAPKGTIRLVQHIEAYLFQISQVPALALCDDVPRPEPLPELDSNSPQAFLLEPKPGGKVDLSEIADSFAHIMAACARPVDSHELAARSAGRGIGAKEAAELAESLLGAGVLRQVEVRADGTVS